MGEKRPKTSEAREPSIHPSGNGGMDTAPSTPAATHGWMDHSPCYAEYIVGALDKLPAGQDASVTTLRENAPKGLGRKADDLLRCIDHLKESDHVVITKIGRKKPSHVKRGSAPVPEAATNAASLKGAKASDPVEEAHKAVKKLMDRRRNVQHMRLNYAWAVQRGESDYAKRIRDHLEAMIKASGDDVPGFYTDMLDQLVKIDGDPKSVLVQANFFPPGERDGDQTGEAFHDLRSDTSGHAYYEQQLQKLREDIKKLTRKLRQQDAEQDTDAGDAGDGGSPVSA